jgi:hypothetical protein
MKYILYWILPILNTLFLILNFIYYRKHKAKIILVILLLLLPVMTFDALSILLLKLQYFTICCLNLLLLLTLGWLYVMNLRELRPFRLLYMPLLFSVIFSLTYFNLTHVQLVVTKGMTTYAFDKNQYTLQIDTLTNDYMLKKGDTLVSYSGDLTNKSMIFFMTMTFLIPIIVNYISSYIYDTTRR